MYSNLTTIQSHATGFQNVMATAQLQPLAPMDSDADVASE